MNCELGESRYRLGLCVTVLCVLAPSVVLIGCDLSSSGVSSSKPADDPVKADFEWAMKRLRRAIENFTPPASLGLRVKRKLSYEMTPPDASNPNYTARVTVDSTTAYHPGRYYPASDDEAEQAETAGEDANSDELLASGEDRSTAIPEELIKGPPPKAVAIDSLVDAPSIEERIVYELVYRDRRWQLETEPDSKHEKMWFEYALQ